METDFSSLDLNKTYTYADYLSWRFKERLEIIKGKILKYRQPRQGNIKVYRGRYLVN